jgi:hypothetical protein
MTLWDRSMVRLAGTIPGSTPENAQEDRQGRAPFRENRLSWDGTRSRAGRRAFAKRPRHCWGSSHALVGIQQRQSDEPRSRVAPSGAFIGLALKAFSKRGEQTEVSIVRNQIVVGSTGCVWESFRSQAGRLDRVVPAIGPDGLRIKGDGRCGNRDRRERFAWASRGRWVLVRRRWWTA